MRSPVTLAGLTALGMALLLVAPWLAQGLADLDAAAAMGRLAGYWRDSYDWRTWEAEINKYPQFTTEIDGQNIHFLHVRSRREDALPLMLTHGWPGSIVEYLKVIEPLSEDFHLVSPRCPGSASPAQPASGAGTGTAPPGRGLS